MIINDVKDGNEGNHRDLLPAERLLGDVAEHVTPRPTLRQRRDRSLRYENLENHLEFQWGRKRR